MKLLVFTQGVSGILRSLLKSRHSIVGIVETQGQKPGTEKTTATQQRSFFMSYQEKGKLHRIAERRGIPYFLMRQGFDGELASWIKDLRPDIGVVYGMSFLLRPEVYAVPAAGIINLHPSFLPWYRGPAPIVWQYVDYELNPGVTVHWIDRGEDTGDVIFRERVSIKPGLREARFVRRVITKTGGRILLLAIEAIEESTAPRKVQPLLSPTPRAARVGMRQYMGMIDWSRPIVELWHFFRGTETVCTELFGLGPAGFGREWTVGSFQNDPQDACHRGRLQRQGRKCVLVCPTGTIEFRRRYRLNLIGSDLLALLFAHR